MPVFRGVDFVHEALRSICNQDHRDFRVLISVDGGDSETAAACQPFLADPRFSLVVQDRRLGWAENINWLMSQPDFDLFCYWQHDDYTSANYISELLRSSFAHPAAVCYFTGIQWFGQRVEWTGSSSVVGPALTRAISIFDSLNGIPLRGLIRKEAIDRVGPIRKTDYESAFEEFVWIGKLAREGNLQYVEGPTYFKRAREDSTHAKWHSKDRLWRRAVWLEFGLGMLETMWPVVPEAERITALSTVLDRLCVPKKGRFLFYDGPTVPFASEFLNRALERFPIPSLESSMSGASPAPVAGRKSVGEILLDQAVRYSRVRRPAPAKAPETLHFRAGEAGIDLLLDGWSSAETWGIWSDGPRAGLRLPVGAKRGPWKVAITFKVFGRRRPLEIFGKRTTVPMEITLPSSQAITWRVPAKRVVRKEFYVESQASDVQLRFAFPEAASPLSLGLGMDPRRLGIGLISIDLTEPA